MRTTGYSLSITGLMQVRGEAKPAGVHTPDECIPAKAYIGALRKRPQATNTVRPPSTMGEGRKCSSPRRH